jgi:hypothetical protein
MVAGAPPLPYPLTGRRSTQQIPMARLVAYGIAAVEPGMFDLGPIPAVKQALERAGWSLGDVERVEINEAFAAIAIAVTRELGLPQGFVSFRARLDVGELRRSAPCDQAARSMRPRRRVTRRRWDQRRWPSDSRWPRAERGRRKLRTSS